MKKSVKSFLLALMALCLTLGAASMASATIASFDVSVDVTVSDGVTAAPLSVKFSSKDANGYGTGKIAYASIDKWGPGSTDTLIAAVQNIDVSFDADATTKQFALKLNSKSDFGKIKYFKIKSGDNGAVEDKTATAAADKTKPVSLDVPGDGGILYVMIIVESGDNTNSSDIVAQIKVTGHELKTEAEGSNAPFTKAHFDLTTDATNGVTPASFDATTTKESETFKLTTDVKVVSIDVSSDVDVKLFTKAPATDITVASASSTTSADKFVVTIGSTATATSFDVHFYMASGDKDASFDVTLKFTRGSDSGKTTTYDFGTITFTPSGATTTTATTVSSNDYSSKVSTSSAVASLDAAKTISYTESGDSTVTVTVAFSNSSTKFVDLYYYNDSDSAWESVSADEYSSGTFMPATDGVYKMVFSGTKDSTTYYFAVGITIADDSSSSGDDKLNPVIDSSALEDPGKTSKQVTTALGSTAILAKLGTTLANAYGVDSTTDFGNATTGYKYVLLELDQAVLNGARIYVSLYPGSSVSTALNNAASMLQGHFTLDIGSEPSTKYLLIKTAGLRRYTKGSTASNSDAWLTITRGQYLPVASIPTTAFTSSVSDLTAAGSEFATFSTAATGTNDYRTDDVMMIADSNITSSKGSSSSGCDAGFGALALLALALPLVKKIKK